MGGHAWSWNAGSLQGLLVLLCSARLGCLQQDVKGEDGDLELTPKPALTALSLSSGALGWPRSTHFPTEQTSALSLRLKPSK